jgi:alpha-tubulin suppressor-like RCC1 family protein
MGPFQYTRYLWVWGANEFGELGDHATVDSSRPLLNSAFPAGTLITKLATGDAFSLAGSHSLALDRNGALWAWGYNQLGQVGDGHGGLAYNVYAPVQVCGPGQTAPCTQFLDGITAIAAGGMHSLALDSSGRVWGWGYNAHGQLGSQNSYTAVPVWNVPLSAQLSQQPGVPIVTAIAAGGNHSLALDSRGTVWAWGLNSLGQVGNGSYGYPVGSYPYIASPISFPQGTTITAIAAGGVHSLALDSEGHVWAWGDNHDGQLGISSNDFARNLPAKLIYFPSNTRITAIAAGAYHSLAVDSGGKAWAWGANAHGQLGNETTVDSHGPVRVSFPDGIRIVIIAAGGAHSLAVDANYNAWAWGLNNHGQLGNQQTGVDSNKPIRSIFPNCTHIMTVAAGSFHSLALESRSFLYGIEAVLHFEPLKAQVHLLPQSLTLDPITQTATSSALDRAGHKLRVTSTLTDTTGNKLVLTFIQQRDNDHSLALQVQSVQYNDGVVMTPPPNRVVRLEDGRWRYNHLTGPASDSGTSRQQDRDHGTLRCGHEPDGDPR